MRGKRIWLYLFMSVYMVVPCISPIYGEQNDSSDIYYYSKKGFYEMQVIVIGNGSLIDGSTEIRSGINIYQLKPKDRKTFRVVADQGNKLKSILYEGKDLRKQLHSKNEVSVSVNDRNTVLIVTFEKESTDNKPDVIKPKPPIRPPSSDKKEDEIKSIITKDIPIEVLKNGITDELIKSYITSAREYTILSHNIQAKKGVYEVVIQFSDGNIQKLEIEVVDNEKKGGAKVELEQCHIHWFILLLIAGYGCYLGMHFYKNAKDIREYKEKIRIMNSREEEHED